MADRGLLQAAGSWSVDACCAVPGNDCHRDDGHCSSPCCFDHASSSDWLFGLGPGPPPRSEPTGTDTAYQSILADFWPKWGHNGDLDIGSRGAPGGTDAEEVGHCCNQGTTYRGTPGEICGGTDNWGATDVEVWYPR